MIFAVLSLFVISSLALKSDPQADTSEQCLSCQAQVVALDIKWTDESNVEKILADLEAQCATLPIKDRKICDGLVAILVQIPPALFEGMASLAWPVPLAPCALLKQCHVNCCGADDPPEQVHLSLTSNDPTKMGVSWVSLNQTSSVIQYGESVEDLNVHVSGTISTYTSAGWVGTIHRATMTDLVPGNSYFYRVGDGDSKWSEIFQFKVLIPGQDVTFAVIGDMAYDEASDNTIAAVTRLVESGKLDCVVHSGDISYADGYEPHWDAFLNKVQPIAARVPYMVSPGNHEFWFNFSSYKARFFMPGVNDLGGSGDNMFYSWEAGNVHFVTMNSETAIDTANFSDYEMAWVDADLKKVNRERTPFVIANFHRPMYCSNDDECDSFGSHLKEQAEDIFYNNAVNVVITGHVHEYERTLPVYQEQSTSSNYDSPSAPVYFMQGASGNREGNKGGIPEDRPEWSAAIFNDVGFATMTVTSSQIEWIFYSTPNSSDIVELDRAVINK